jgi:hypothetical protein
MSCKACSIACNDDASMSCVCSPQTTASSIKLRLCNKMHIINHDGNLQCE